ncbi:MAG: TIGR00159 family protein [Pedosphaera sp.]|nr:TIGR00159 family protein [Pedosphaera sp.]
MEQLLEIVSILWRPCVEILALATVIYYLFYFFQRTRGWPVVVGFLVLLALTLITELANMQVLAWVLETLFAISALAILILFQPELRRLLAELGNLPLFSQHSAPQPNLTALLQAVERLSKNRTGAIIALERSIQIAPEVESGVAVDATLSTELIETLFFQNSPMHDGGVVLKGERITHAACIFPLTHRPNLSASLGTRHRAAIGLTEETDAIAIVVSEETGGIAFCEAGDMKKDIPLAELQQLLESRWSAGQKQPAPELPFFVRIREHIRAIARAVENTFKPK